MSDFNPYAVTPQGFGSDVWTGEWQEFLRVRQELVDEGMRRLGLATQLSFTTGTSPQQAFQTLRYIPSPREQRLMERQQRVDDREHQRLLGAADFYGIEGAERMDPQELLQVIEARREIVARIDEDNLGGSPYETLWNTITDTFQTALGVGGLNAVDAVIDGSKHIPFFGGMIRNSAAVQRYQRGLAMLEEGFTADMVDNERAAYERFAQPLSHFLGYSALIGVTAEGVGATGFPWGIANPIIRGAMQGGAVGTILEGGSDQPLQNIALFAALGGGGTAAGLGLAKLWTRLQGSFPRAFDRWRGIYEAEMRSGYDPGVMEAEILGGEGRAVVPWTPPGGAPMGAPPPLIGPGPRGALPSGSGGAVVGPGVYEMPGIPPRMLPAPSGPPGTFVAPAGTTQFPAWRGSGVPTMEAAGVAIPPGPWRGNPYVESGKVELVPISWARGLLEFNRAATHPTRVSELAVDIQSNGLREPLVLQAGKQDRLAVLGEGNHRLAALEQLGYTHVPARVIVQGQLLRGHPAQSMVPQPGEYFPSDAAPSAVFGQIGSLPAAYVPTPRLDAASAAADATALTKQGTVLESPALPQFSRQPILDDADVALAAIATNPGQVSVIQNVGDVGKTVRRFLQEFLPNGVGPQEFRVVERELPLRDLPLVPKAAPRPVPEVRFAPGVSWSPEAQAQFESSWAMVSARYPRLAGEVERIIISPHAAGAYGYGQPISAAWNYSGGARELIISPEEAITPSILVHEFTHVAQTARGQLPEELTLMDLARSEYYATANELSTPGSAEYADKMTRIMQNYAGMAGIRPRKLSYRRADILVSDGAPITNQMVRDYETFGMFRGQKATTASGQEVTVVELGPEMSLVAPIGVTRIQGTLFKYTGGPIDEFSPAPADIVIHRNTRADEEPWRASFIDETLEEQAVGHTSFASLEEARKYAQNLSGYKEVSFAKSQAYLIPTRSLLPGRTSAVSPVAPEAYIEMKAYALSRMAYEAQASGFDLSPRGASLTGHRPGDRRIISRNTIPGEQPWRMTYFEEGQVVSHADYPTYEAALASTQEFGGQIVEEHLGVGRFDWFSEELSSQLPRYIEEFLDMRGVSGMGLRGTYTSLFTELRTAEFKTLAPEEFAQAEALAQEAAQLEARRFLEGRPLYLGEVAETKGMEWIRTPNSLGGELRDRLTGEVIPVASEEAAFAFLRDFNRTPPDYSPATVVPAELFSAGPGAANPGSTAAPDFQGSLVELVEQGNRELDELAEWFGGAGGGGGGFPPSGGGAFELPPPNGPGYQFAQLKQNRYQRYQQLERRFDNGIQHLIEPMRGFAARMTEHMRRAGLDVNYWDDIVGVQNSTAVAQNEMHAWANELSSLLSQIRSVRVRNGTVTVIQELPEDQALAAMANAGYTEREMAAQLGLKQLIARMGDEYGVRHIIDYMPHLRAAGSPEIAAQMLLRHDFTGPGRWFAEMVRQGGVEFREMNAEVLLHKWIRGAAYSRHVAPHVDRVNTTWVQDENIPENLREITSRWLSLVVTGYVPGGVRIAPGIASVFNSVGVPINAREVAGIMRWANSNVYRAWLGGKPYAVLREFINPLLGWARIGNTADLTYTMQRFGRDAAFREEVKELGLRGGWIMRAPLASTAQEMFRAPDAALPGLARPENEFNAVQNFVREGVARVGDVAYDALGRLAPQGYSNTWLDPMRPIDKVNELGRMLSGYSAYRTMTRAIGEFRAALAENPFQELRPLHAKLLRDSGAANLHESLQRAVIERVIAGADEDAAFSFANEVANQLARMGAADQPPMFQQFGEFGKWGSMFGNFSIQFRSNAWEGLRRSGLAPEFGGTSVDGVVAGTKFAARHALILGSLGLAAGYTGWNFNKWFWHGALGWGGGPFLWGFVDSVRAWTARNKQANGEYLTPEEEAVLVETNAPPMWTALVNPYLGAMQTVEQAGRMMESSNPLENTASYLVTGSRESPAAVRQFGDPGALWPQQPLFPGGGGASQ